MKFVEVKDKIRNIGKFKTLKEIKESGLRIVKNTKSNDYWLVEEEFLKPVIKSPRECKSILIKPEDLKYKVFMCHKSKEELKGTKVSEYIEWGESQHFHQRPSCKGRKYWWEISEQEKALCSYPMINNDRLIFCKNENIYNDANLVGIYPKNNFTFDLIYSLNSTYNMTNMELLGIANLGEGAIKQNPIYIKKAIVVNPKFIKIKNAKYLNRPILSIFQELGLPKPNQDFSNINPKDISLSKVLPDRRALDKIAFETIGLTEQEQLEVYQVVVELVKNRLAKARSV